MKLDNILSKGKRALIVPMLGLAGASASPYETKDVCDSFFWVPEFLEPGSCADARAEVRAREAEYRRAARERGEVYTPQSSSTFSHSDLQKMCDRGSRVTVKGESGRKYEGILQCDAYGNYYLVDDQGSAISV